MNTEVRDRASLEEPDESQSQGDSKATGSGWGDTLKGLAVLASGIGAAVGAALLIEHFTDDTDPKQYTPNGVRLSAEILAAYTALQGFFEGGETIEASRARSTAERMEANQAELLRLWPNLSYESAAVFEAMPGLWADVQDYWGDLNDDERESIRQNWSPLDDKGQG